MEDKEIIGMFRDRNHDAITEIQKKYGKLCFQIGKNITGSLEDAEEIENETYLGLWNRIPPERPEYLKSFVCRIAKNLSIDRVRYHQAEKRKRGNEIPVEEVSDILSGVDTPENVYEQKELAELISEFLREQKPEVRKMFLRRYWFYDSIGDIATNFGVSESKVKVTLHRVRKSLKKYLMEQEVTL